MRYLAPISIVTMALVGLLASSFELPVRLVVTGCSAALLLGVWVALGSHWGSEPFDPTNSLKSLYLHVAGSVPVCGAAALAFDWSDWLIALLGVSAVIGAAVFVAGIYVIARSP